MRPRPRHGPVTGAHLCLLSGELPHGQREAENGDHGGDGRQGPSGPFEGVESASVFLDLLVGLVVALHE